MKIPRLGSLLPSWKNALLAGLAAVLLILAFPDFEFWFLAWFALVPLMWAVEREKASTIKSFVLGWIFGTIFFFGTCWWLAYAPIHYAAFPWPLAYSLIFVACLISGIFPGIFAAILAVLLRRIGSWAFLAAPFVWVFSEFARYWLTGNNWNAIGYSQAFNFTKLSLVENARIGGIYLTGLWLCFSNVIAATTLSSLIPQITANDSLFRKPLFAMNAVFGSFLGIVLFFPFAFIARLTFDSAPQRSHSGRIIAIQPNVPMIGLDYNKWQQLRQRQFDLAEAKIKELTTDNQLPTTVVLPESPMNFMYNDDREFQQFVRDFTTKNNVSLLFNSAEPDAANGKFFNSAVMIDSRGNKIAEYDKIYLLPFGEAVPVPFESIVPAFVGSFSYGKEYDLLPLGDAKAGVMICFESHFGQLSREYVRNGADVITEMTNDGYLGPTPVLRQHLANAVFRAVETNRPVLRVTNVGITAYIDERGRVLDPTASYTEDTRVWSISKSDGKQTFYVRYGDWFAWLCSIVTFGLLGYAIFRRRQQTV